MYILELDKVKKKTKKNFFPGNAFRLSEVGVFRSGYIYILKYRSQDASI